MIDRESTDRNANVYGQSAGVDWLVPRREEQSPQAAAELARELSPGHPLWQVSVRALARRQDCDDVLFALEDGTGRVAVVHLTYQIEHGPCWPSVALFDDLGDFRRSRMQADHEAFIA